MKKVLFVLVLLFTINCFSQNFQLQDFINYYNKTFLKENTFLSSERYYTEYCTYGYDNIKSIYCSKEYGNERLDYLEKYLYDSMFNIRRVACELIYNVGVNSDDIKVRQRAVEDLLNMYFITSDYICDQLIDDFRISDFSDKTKKRIEVIIQRKLTQTEIEFIVDFDVNSLDISGFFLRRANEILEKDTTKSLDFLIDSIKNAYKQRVFRGVKARGGDISSKMILLVGWLYMYEAIPLLNSMLNNKTYIYFENDIKMALARMGNKQYEKEILSKIDEDHFYNAIYINTQESAEFFIKKYINSNKLTSLFGDNNPRFMFPASWNYYNWYIQTWILNLPKKYKFDENFYSDVDTIEFNNAKKWLNKNIGKFKLNPNMSF